MGYRRSKTCTGAVSQQPLTEYDTFEDARHGAAYARHQHGSHMTPYPCDRCGKWHLTPSERRTPSHTCDWCRGSDGKAKEAYVTEEDAERRARILLTERGVRLRAYECEHGSGWHLTKG